MEARLQLNIAADDDHQGDGIFAEQYSALTF
jgi:hypothetical protein